MISGVVDLGKLLLGSIFMRYLAYKSLILAGACPREGGGEEDVLLEFLLSPLDLRLRKDLATRHPRFRKDPATRLPRESEDPGK